MSWTDERVETLKKLWQEGHSASQIAKQLGGVTRNAVIGKVHRLGLSGRAAPSQPARPLFKATRPARPAASQLGSGTGHAASGQGSASGGQVNVALSPVARRSELSTSRAAPTPIVNLPELPGTATVLTLGAKMCKWPIGDPSSETFSFCGRRASDGIPYCVEHSRVAYQPTQKKKKDTGTDLSRSLRRYL